LFGRWHTQARFWLEWGSSQTNFQDVRFSQTRSAHRCTICFMPWGLKRFHHSRQTHFVTFCCFHRFPLFVPEVNRRVFEANVSGGISD
jgi:hypothetical protein